MSQENVEVVRAVFETWNAGDMDALRELYDPGVILCAPEGWLEPGPWVGQEAVMREWEHVREGWNADVAEPISDFIDAGDRVAVRKPGVLQATARKSTWRSQTSLWCARAESSTRSSSGTTPRPSKPWGWRSKIERPAGHK